MRPSRHIITSLSIGVIFWFFTKSVYASILCLVSGILVDFDHVMEYIIHCGWSKLSFKKIYDACEQTERQKRDGAFKRLYLIFHVGEVALLLWAATVYTRNIYLLALSVGYTSHIILDVIGNQLHPFSYFLLWRAINNFDTDKLF